MQPSCTEEGDDSTGSVSPREFIRVWQDAGSLAEVAQRVRSKKNACRVRAYRYRRLGIPLKEFPPVVQVELTDWDELAEYAASLLPDDEARRAAGWTDSDEPPESETGDDSESSSPDSPTLPAVA
jgi:hypothetical protein